MKPFYLKYNEGYIGHRKSRKIVETGPSDEDTASIQGDNCRMSVCEADLEVLRSFVIMLKVETKTRMTLMTG